MKYLKALWVYLVQDRINLLTLLVFSMLVASYHAWQLVGLYDNVKASCPQQIEGKK